MFGAWNAEVVRHRTERASESMKETSLNHSKTRNATIFWVTCVLLSTAGHGPLASLADDSMGVRSGDQVLAIDFDDGQQRDNWTTAEAASWGPGWQGTTSLLVDVSAEQAGSANMVHQSFPVSEYRGCRLLFECMAKAERVSEPDEAWLGVKFMLHYTSPTDGSFWQNQNGVFGTFDWKQLRFVTTIAPDAENGQLSLGLQGSWGKVMFDQIRVTVIRGPLPARPQPPKDPGPIFKGHDLPRLRGVMSPQQFREEDLQQLGEEWRANVIRWQMTRNWGRVGTDRDLDEYDRWLDGELDDLERALEASQRYGMKVVVDMHSPPGGRYENRDLAIFHERKYQQHFVLLWEKIARRFKGNQAVWGYDLVNEPVQNLPSPTGVTNYLDTQRLVALAIRKIDPQVPIIIEASQWDSASGFRELMPLDIPRLIYQVHMYVPHEYTHQGVHDSKVGWKYPGMIQGKKWDRKALREVLTPVREFQLAYNVHIYVGEFSAIRWAPGAADYLRDCIELFEEYDWDWTYHAYREWDGWSVEHTDDRENRQPAGQPTERMQLLLQWFAKNKKPF
jgi:endoglucanase